MSQIRNTIELLTKILRENGTSKVKAETFRLAKFNEDDAVPIMWKLLFELLYFCEYGKIDDVTIEASNKLTHEELAVYVKTEIQKRGFLSKDLTPPSPQHISSACGSRELLLVFAWLLSKEDIVTQFMKRCTSPLEEQDTAFLYAQERKLVMADDAEMPEATEPVCRVQQLLWLNNKLQLNLRSLYALNRQKMLLQHTVHEATRGSAMPEVNHLSMLEVFMLRKPELLKKNLQLLEKDNERLQNLLKWKKCEDVFWKWMESVLDAKEQDAIVHQNTKQSPRNLSAIPVEMVSRLRASRRHLQNTISKYEAIVHKLDEAWDSKSSEISEDELDTVLSSLNLELSIQKAHITFHNTQSHIENETERVTAVPYAPQLTHVPRQCTHPINDGPAEPQEMSQEIARMQNFVQHLQEDVYKKQESFKAELHNLSSHFSDAICIPPMTQFSSMHC